MHEIRKYRDDCEWQDIITRFKQRSLEIVEVVRRVQDSEGLKLMAAEIERFHSDLLTDVELNIQKGKA